jgi:hypothetical protein
MFSSNTSSAAGDANFVEDVFSTYLYTGTGASQTITNNIDLAGKGGLVWARARSASNHFLGDTVRGVNQRLITNVTNADTADSSRFNAFNSNGFETGINLSATSVDYVSWTFREQPKFFDVVTYTGNGSGSQTIAHTLGATPGCIIVKRTDNVSSWFVYHRSGQYGQNGYLLLDSTNGESNIGADVWTPTSTTFQANSTFINLNINGATYVAYLFAHNAGGFGLTGTDNVISCGSFTTDGSGNASVTLGYEPQWVMIKQTDDTGSWFMLDTVRGWSMSDDARLFANSSDSETTFANGNPTSTGFSAVGFSASGTFIYIAIRRGPMKVPTTGTSVFAPVTYAGNNTDRTISAPFVTDLAVIKNRTGDAASATWADRLRANNYLSSASTASEGADPSVLQTNPWDVQGGVKIGNGANRTNNSASTYVDWMFQRAPSFFDEVCWTGDGTNPRSISHNLTVAPTLIITKKRNSTSNWNTGYDFAATTYKYFYLNDTAAAISDTYTNSPVYGGNPTASVFIVGNQGGMNGSGDTYVSYLFATCPGVSKVGTYVGTGTTLQVDCGFTAGSRFVLIKRTDSTGDWYVWDSARGIVAGNDPYLLLNSTAAEVTSTDYVDTFSSGFEISSTAPAAINASGGTFIFLAIA